MRMSNHPEEAAMRSPHFQLSWTLAILVALTTALAAALTAQTAEAGMRCGSKIISEGDSKARVLMACGEPFLEDLIAVERVGESGELTTTTFVEEWSYPNPAGEDPHTLRFEGSRVVGPGIRCKRGVVSEGNTKAEVILKCSEPRMRDLLNLRSAPPASVSNAPVTERRIEQWSYRLGKGKLIRLVTFRDGKVSAIEDGIRE
jgi:hypothetical protein